MTTSSGRLAASGCGTLTLLLSCLVLVACAGSYDSSADDQIVAITKDGNALFTNLESKAATAKGAPYDEADYTSIESDIKALIVRLSNSADSETQAMSSVATKAYDAVERVRIRNEKGPLRVGAGNTYLIDSETAFNTQMGLLSSFELLMKGGSSAMTASKDPNSSAKAQKGASAVQQAGTGK